MSEAEQRESLRDMKISSFGEILKALCQRFKQIEAAVFYDGLGETIDYFSNEDPFLTRLMAAYHGLIFETTKERCKWLDMGVVDMIELFTEKKDTLTMWIGEGVCLTVVASSGGIDSEIFDSLVEVKELLREEAGF